MGTYDTHTSLFENRSKLEDLPVQSPIPLGKNFRYFVVTQQEVSPTDGKGASVGLATCSVRKLKRKKKNLYETEQTVLIIIIFLSH
jgi:hypothetical protein